MGGEQVEFGDVEGFGAADESGPCVHVPKETRAVALEWLGKLPR